MVRITDDERRRVAERLRDKKAECEERWYPWTCDDLILALGYDHDYEAGDEIFDRLADLIDPDCGTEEVGTSQVPKLDPTGRGIDSIYDWCRERLEGADGAEDELCCSIMRAVDEYRHPELVTARTVRAVDREALLVIADEMDRDGRLQRERQKAGERWFIDGLDVRDYARRIREACGVVA